MDRPSSTTDSWSTVDIRTPRHASRSLASSSNEPGPYCTAPSPTRSVTSMGTRSPREQPNSSSRITTQWTNRPDPELALEPPQRRDRRRPANPSPITEHPRREPRATAAPYPALRTDSNRQGLDKVLGNLFADAGGWRALILGVKSLGHSTPQ